METQTWYTVTVQDKYTGERSIVQQKATDQDNANQKVWERITGGDLAYPLLVVID